MIIIVETSLIATDEDPVPTPAPIPPPNHDGLISYEYTIDRDFPGVPGNPQAGGIAISRSEIFMVVNDTINVYEVVLSISFFFSHSPNRALSLTRSLSLFLSLSLALALSLSLSFALALALALQVNSGAWQRSFSTATSGNPTNPKGIFYRLETDSLWIADEVSNSSNSIHTQIKQ